MICLLSDIHGNLEALNAVLDDSQRFNITDFIIAGDLIDYGADSVKVIGTVYDLVKRGVVTSIAGNHDVLSDESVSIENLISTKYGRQSMEITREEMKDFLQSDDSFMFNDLTCYLEQKLDCNVRIGHANVGVSSSDLLYSKFGKLISSESCSNVLDYRAGRQVNIIGHSHIQGYQYRNGQLYVNPGSVGQPRNGDCRAQYALLDTDSCQVRFRRVDYDIEKASRKIIKSGRDRFLANRLYFGV